MKITIKNQEYKLLHNIPKGTRLIYNDEECVKAETSNMLVGINTGNTYALPSTKKIYMDSERKQVFLYDLLVGDFFVYEKQLYILLTDNYLAETFNFNTKKFEYLKGAMKVEQVQDKNIQITVK